MPNPDCLGSLTTVTKKSENSGQLSKKEKGHPRKIGLR
jgi:hypothetical protein